MSTEQARSEAAAILGAIKTPKKAKAARRNGRLGGRPKGKKKRSGDTRAGSSHNRRVTRRKAR